MKFERFIFIFLFLLISCSNTNNSKIAIQLGNELLASNYSSFENIGDSTKEKIKLLAPPVTCSLWDGIGANYSDGSESMLIELKSNKLSMIIRVKEINSKQFKILGFWSN